MEKLASPPAPLVRSVVRNVRYLVSVELDPSPTSWVMGDGGARIRPQVVAIEYLNGKLWTCRVRGRKVRVDGHEYLDGSYGERSFMSLELVPGSRVPRSRVLSDRAPEWLAALVRENVPGNSTENRS